MPITYLKKSSRTAETGHQDVQATVQSMLDELEKGREETARRFARTLDGWDGDILVSPEALETAKQTVPQKLKDDIHFAQDNIQRFAEAQKSTISECALEIVPGFTAGQKQIPLSAAGCYVPGGRYSHVASAMMTITTAKVAGVSHIAACSPPRPGVSPCRSTTPPPGKLSSTVHWSPS